MYHEGHIEDLIPYGAENAVTRDYLCERRGTGDSTMRIELSEAKLRVPIVSSCKMKGYFRPRADRPEEVRMARECRDELKNKALTMLSQLKVLDQFINPSGQMELFPEDC